MAIDRKIVAAFSQLGLTPLASRDDIVAARRRLANELHPDRSDGDGAIMAEINLAFDIALAHLTQGPAASTMVDRERSPQQSIQHDHPSFTVDVLPVDAFEALRIVTSWIGEMIDEDPPYLLEVRLGEPYSSWCRLELVPDAGATTVTVSVMGEIADPTFVEVIRDLWIGQLNRLNWQDLDADQQRPL